MEKENQAVNWLIHVHIEMTINQSELAGFDRPYISLQLVVSSNSVSIVHRFLHPVHIR